MVACPSHKSLPRLDIMPRTVLITGCSDGGLGAALAVAFHKHGDRVIATARNPAKMASLKDTGIETVQLDVMSEDSIKAAVEAVSKLTGGSLDMLVNNAGAGYTTPLLEASVSDMAKLFDTNTLSVIRVTQLFFPLLRNAKDGAFLVNNTSVASSMPVPLQAPYSATKAALSSLTECLRLELQPFDIKVIELKTGQVQSYFHVNATSSGSSEVGLARLRADSLYAPGKEAVEKFMRSDLDGMTPMPADQWAELVVKDLSKKNPSPQIWRGGQVFQTWFATLLPTGLTDGWVQKLTGLGLVAQYYHALKANKTK